MGGISYHINAAITAIHLAIELYTLYITSFTTSQPCGCCSFIPRHEEDDLISLAWLDLIQHPLAGERIIGPRCPVHTLALPLHGRTLIATPTSFILFCFTDTDPDSFVQDAPFPGRGDVSPFISIRRDTVIRVRKAPLPYLSTYEHSH